MYGVCPESRRIRGSLAARILPVEDIRGEILGVWGGGRQAPEGKGRGGYGTANRKGDIVDCRGGYRACERWSER